MVHVEHARTPHPTERVRDGPAVRVPTSGTAPLRPRAGPRRVAWRRRTRVTGPAERAGGRPPAAVRARKDPTDSRHLDHGDLRRGNDDTGPGAPALAEGRESTRPPAFTSDRARRPLIGGDDCGTCSTHPALIKTTSRRGAITTPSWSAAAPRRRRRGAQSRGPTVRIGPGPPQPGADPATVGLASGHGRLVDHPRTEVARALPSPRPSSGRVRIRRARSSRCTVPHGACG